MISHLKNRIYEFQSWFKSKATPRDRAWTAAMGLWAGIWLGIIIRFIYSNPVPISGIFYAAIIGSISSVILGAIFPKYLRIVFLPFCFFSIGGAS